jgi:hypothetical protein
MTIQLPSKPGIAGAKVLSIPKDWDPAWFRSFVNNLLKGADVRNAIAGAGITITGNISSPYATISATGGGGGVTSVSLNDSSTVSIYATSPTAPTAGAVTETITLKNQTANTVFAGPTTGAAAQPSFRALVAADLTGLTGGANVQTFVQSGGNTQTWTKPSCNYVRVICRGGGGGGGGGGKGVAGSSAGQGGGAGAGGSITYYDFNAADLPGTVSVLFSSTSGGTGGTPATVTGPGNNGTVGANATFGTLLYAPGGQQGFGNGSNGSVGTLGLQSGTAGGSGSASAAGTGGQAMSGSVGAATTQANTGGGGGGGVPSTSGTNAGGTGGSSNVLLTPSIIPGGTAGTAGGGNGGQGNSGTAYYPAQGGGGGGSAAGVNNAGNGGAGGTGGGGGGGGGGAQIGTPGTGGLGAPALIYVITW